VQPTIGRVSLRTADPAGRGARPAADDPPEGNAPVGGGPPRRPRPTDPLAGLGPPPPADRFRGWVVTIALTLVAAVVRLSNLGLPTDQGTPVFDEKHYVPQAWQVLRNGGVEDNPGYELIVHPPLAKQLIALSEWVLGYDPVGWRMSAALSGVVVVLLVIRVARRLTRSTMLGGVAGVLLICDGLSHVQSRMGMLDAFQAAFVLAAFATLVCDRDDVRARLAVVVSEGRAADSPYGPRFGVRWWRLATGVLLGLGCAVKWSTVYWVVAFGVLMIVWDLTGRRVAGVPRPVRGTVRRDLGWGLWALGLVPVLTYVSSWWAWFRDETATDRFEVGDKIGADGPWSFLPDALRSLWYYHGKVLDFHAGLTTTASGMHPWESKPWSWPMGLRPMLYHYAENVGGCGQQNCVSSVMLIGTPALWWPSLAVLAFALWRLGTRFDWRYGAVLVGYAAGIVPWFIDYARQMYYFYMTPVAPFLVLATVLAMGEVLGRAGASAERRQTGLLVVGLWVGLVVANFVWLWPILNGVPITPELREAELWLPSWR
jgi:dolichyl-phosphate-mannose-protein mannosyltransferase